MAPSWSTEGANMNPMVVANHHHIEYKICEPHLFTNPSSYVTGLRGCLGDQRVGQYIT